MLGRMLRHIIVTAVLVIAWSTLIGYWADSTAGAVKGVFQGLVVAAAVAVGLVFPTLDGRTRFSRQFPAATQADSVERQVFVTASSATFVDVIGLALVSSAFVIVYPDLVPAAVLLLGTVGVALVDFGIRYGLLRRNLVGSE